MLPTRRGLRFPLWFALLLFAAPGTGAEPFSFSEQERQQQREEELQKQRVEDQVERNLRTECPVSVRDQRILLVVSEVHLHGLSPVYRFDAGNSQLFQYINQAFHKLGFKTYTQQQITARIAEAELRAVANGDLDAALEASRRLGADYILKANIGSRSGRNPILGIRELYVNMDVEMQSPAGDLVGTASAYSDSFAGEDTLAVAKSIAREHADLMASRLYRDLCRYHAAREP